MMNVSVLSAYQPQSKILFAAEENFDYKYHQIWFRQYWHISLYFLAAYVFFVFGGKSYMKERPRFELRTALILWNAGLAIFSIIGALRTVPEITYVLRDFGFQYSVCVPSFVEQNKVSAFWGWMFNVSKLLELGDTVFIVLRKQKLIFLHWYHHIVVAFYCWFTIADYPAMSRWFISMNFTVHGFMYTYYALRALKFTIPTWVAMAITTMQIFQMVVGTTVAAYATYYLYRGYECHIQFYQVLAAQLMYLSFFVLFFIFFLNAYFRSKSFRAGKKES